MAWRTLSSGSLRQPRRSRGLPGRSWNPHLGHRGRIGNATGAHLRTELGPADRAGAELEKEVPLELEAEALAKLLEAEELAA